MSEWARRIAENVAEVRGRMAAAAARAGRHIEQIQLVAVTKYVGIAEIRALVEAGCTLLGESRPQQLWQKAEALGDLPIHWHLVGHLQRNKIRRTLPWVELIESADSPRLVTALDRIAGELSRRIAVLLEVNISGEAAKHGFEPAAVGPFLAQAGEYHNVDVRGLMCMARLDGGRDAARADFAALRSLRDQLREQYPPNATLRELSMGMSGDFEEAIEEGATIVRVGSALFEGIEDHYA